MDIDFLVERNGKFLVLEAKGPNVEIGKGQRRALEALARIPQFTVATVWGEPDEPTHLQKCVRGLWRPQTPITSGDLWGWGADWWLYANGRRRA